MTEDELEKRLEERKVCVAQHKDTLRVPHNGFGWSGSRCSKCGFMFFEEWDFRGPMQ